MKKMFLILFFVSSLLFATIPSTPTLVLPSANATEIAISSYTFKWNTSTGTPTSYHIQISMVSNFSYYTLRDSALTDTLKAVTTLSANTKYFWRVRAKNGDGISAWSTVRSFTTIITLPIRPALTAGNGTNEKFFRMGKLAPYVAWDSTTATRGYYFIDSTVTPHDTLYWGKINLNDDYTWYGKHTFKNIVTFDSTMVLDSAQYFGSNNFTSGFGGLGWKLDYGLSEVAKSNLEFDNLIVRGRLSVYELLVRQIRATNGAIFVTASAKVSNVVGTTVTFYDPSYTGTTYMCPFAAGDLLQVQRFRPDGTTVIKLSKATVSSVSGADAIVVWNTGTFAIGDEVVRIGNTTDASRQNSIYLTSDDSNSPFMDMTSGVNSWTAWGSSDKTKLRLGNLNGTYGYASAHYGLAIGKYSSNFTNVTVDTVNGFRIRNYTTTLGQWANDGSITVGEVGASKSNVIISSNAVKLRTNTTDKLVLNTDGSITLGEVASGKNNILINADSLSLRTNTTSNITLASGGTGYFRGNITSTATITGGTIQTATSGARVVINSTGSSNDIKIYDASALAGTISAASGVVNIDGHVSVFGNTIRSYVTGGDVLLSGTLNRCAINFEDMHQGYDSDANYYFAKLGGTAIDSKVGLYLGSSATATPTYDVNLYRSGANVLTTDDTFDALALQIGVSKFLVNPTGQITKVNNILASSVTGQYLKSDGTSFTPTAFAGVTGSGTINELAYWTSSSAIGTLAVATYPSLTELSYVKGLTSSAQTHIGTKQPQLNGTGFVKASGTTISYDNSTYTTLATVVAATNTWTAENSFDKFKLNAEVSHSVTGTGNYSCTDKNVIILTPTASGYTASLTGLSINRPILVLNGSGTYTVTVNSTTGGKLLAVYGTAWIMYNGTTGVTYVL